MTRPAALVVVANARIPSQRAQSVQLMQAASAFARAGAATTLLVALRRRNPPLPAGQDLFDWYGVAPGARPALETAPCTDWVDLVPPALQYAPARVQELTFARNAARAVRERHAQTAVLARELEVARHLVRAGHARVFLELHRVPAGGLRRRWLAEAVAGARGVVAISGGVREDLAALGVAPRAIRVEHDALDPAPFRGAPGRERARAELGIEPAAQLAVYTGGLLAWKGADLLPAVARALPDVRFVVAGGMDRDVARLRAAAAGVANLRVDGFQAPARVPLYLAAADVALAPNRSQPAISARYTSPLKVFEAMAAGVPLVASDLPSLREILEPERDAVLVAPDDPAALAAGVARLLGDPALRERIRARLLARSAEHTWDARAARLLDWMGGGLMRVLYLTDSLSDLDGVGRYTIRLVTALEALEPGLEVEVLLARKHRPTSSQVPGHWKISVGLPPDYFFNMSRARFWPSFVMGVKTVLPAARRADLVHAIKDYPHSFVAAAAARLARKPAVATAHGTYSVQPLLVPRHHRLARWTYRRMGAVIAVSRYTARRMREHLSEDELPSARLHVIPNAVDAAHYEAPRAIGARPWHGQAFTLGIGELKERKGHHLALAGWARVAARHPELHHYVVGKHSDEDYRRRLESEAAAAGVAQRVHLVGNVTEDEKVDLLQRALAFVHTPVTSRDGGFEGFGIVYLEAAACGTLSIGTRDSGAEDAVADGESGFLVEPEVTAVEQALERVVGDAELRARMRASARAHARASTWPENARRVLEIYRGLLR